MMFTSAIIAVAVVVLILAGYLWATTTGTVTQGTIVSADLSATANLQRSQSVTRTLGPIPLPLLDLREWDTLSSLLPSAATGTYLGLVTGTYGTNAPQVQTGDLHSAGATTRRARMIVVVPDNYVAAGNFQIQCFAGMKTTIADTLATILVEAYQINDDAAADIGSNLVTTSAQSINSLTFAAKNFVLNAATLVPGSRLDVRVSIAVTDAGTGTAVIGALHDLLTVCDMRP